MLTRMMLAVVVLAACGLAGCNPAAKLIGKWEADFSGATAEVENTGNPLAALAGGMMSAVKSQTEFKADGTFSVSSTFFGTTITTTGTWRYAKSEGNVLVLMAKKDKDDVEREMRVNFIDNDHFEMAPPAEVARAVTTKLSFARVKS